MTNIEQGINGIEYILLMSEMQHLPTFDYDALEQEGGDALHEGPLFAQESSFNLSVSSIGLQSNVEPYAFSLRQIKAHLPFVNKKDPLESKLNKYPLINSIKNIELGSSVYSAQCIQNKPSPDSKRYHSANQPAIKKLQKNFESPFLQHFEVEEELSKRHFQVLFKKVQEAERRNKVTTIRLQTIKKKKPTELKCIDQEREHQNIFIELNKKNNYFEDRQINIKHCKKLHHKVSPYKKEFIRKHENSHNFRKKILSVEHKQNTNEKNSIKNEENITKAMEKNEALYCEEIKFDESSRTKNKIRIEKKQSEKRNDESMTNSLKKDKSSSHSFSVEGKRIELKNKKVVDNKENDYFTPIHTFKLRKDQMKKLESIKALIRAKMI